MKIRLLVTILLLVFVAASLVTLFLKGTGGESTGTPGSDGPAGSGNAAVEPAPGGDTKIIVYYFHGNARCKTCLTIEMYALEAIETGFSEALKAGRIEFLPVNLELAGNEHYIDDFQLAARTVVLERVVDGERRDYLNLHRVWELVGNKEAYIAYVQKETEKLMNGES